MESDYEYALRYGRVRNFGGTNEPLTRILTVPNGNEVMWPAGETENERAVFEVFYPEASEMLGNYTSLMRAVCVALSEWRRIDGCVVSVTYLLPEHPYALLKPPNGGHVISNYPVFVEIVRDVLARNLPLSVALDWVEDNKQLIKESDNGPDGESG